MYYLFIFISPITLRLGPCELDMSSKRAQRVQNRTSIMRKGGGGGERGGGEREREVRRENER